LEDIFNGGAINGSDRVRDLQTNSIDMVPSTLDYFVTKYNLDFSESPIEIPEVGRIDIVRWIRELDLKTFAEIGVDHADFSKLIVDNNPQLILYGIDPYLKYKEYREYHDQAEMDNIYEQALFKMRNSIQDGKYVPVRKTSEEALNDFEDNSLDGVYIDANHEGEYPYYDIVNWTRKVKPGGLVMGHDYVRIRSLDFTIKDALEKYTTENNINPWFVVGSSEKRAGEIRDRVRSWFFVKQ
jgi:hypothetical protein